MQNPYLKKRGDSPPHPKNSFQRELDQKIKERAKKGLAADVTSDDDDDDDGIEDDNELFSNFNLTSKTKRDGYLKDDSRGDAMMLTLKKPLQPPSSWRMSSPHLSKSKGQRLGSMDEKEEELDESDEEPKKMRPSFLRNQSSKESIQQRPKSPSIYGRRQSSKDIDEVDSISLSKDSSHQRAATPSAGGSMKEDRKMSSGRGTPKLSKSPISRKSSDGNLSNKSPSPRHTPTESRKSPHSGRKTPIEDSMLLESVSRRTPTEIRESPTTIFGEKRDFVQNGGHRSPKLFVENRKTPVDGPKSPRTVGGGSKSPGLFESRKTPTDDRKSPGLHPLKKKSSVLDFLEESSSTKKHFDDDNDDDRAKVEMTKKKISSTPELHSVKISTIQSSTHQQSLEDDAARRLSDGEGSVFEEKLGEPIQPTITRTATTDKEKPKIKMVKIQRTAKKETEETIDVIEESQNGSQKMKYIDPVKNEAFKSGKKRPASGKILRPRPIYSSTGTLSRASGSSNEALNFDSAQDIRQAVYEVWKVQAMDKMKQAAKEKMQKQRELEEKQKKEKNEKALESKATYDAWMDKKKGFVSTNVIKAKLEEQRKKKEEEKRKEKQKEAEELFSKWKESKDVLLKEKHREKVKTEKREIRSKEEKEMDKRKEAESAFKKWSENKEDHLKNEAKEKARRIKQQKEEENRERVEQLNTAKDLYEKWLEKKQESEAIKRPTDMYEEDTRRPWRPSSTKIHHIC